MNLKRNGLTIDKAGITNFHVLQLKGRLLIVGFLIKLFYKL